MRAKPLTEKNFPGFESTAVPDQKNFLEIQGTASRTQKNFLEFQRALIKKIFRGNSRAERPQAKKKFPETRLPVGGIFKTCRPGPRANP